MVDGQERQLFRIAEADNVYVLLRSMPAGTVLQIGGRKVTHESALELGHKIAARDIAAGEKVFKYGAPIGSATCDIQAGEHVHLHNMQSDYIPTYTMESESE